MLMLAAILDKVSLGTPSAYRNLTLTPILLKDGPLSPQRHALIRRSAPHPTSPFSDLDHHAEELQTGCAKRRKANEKQVARE
jgi:hypothetical protein